MINTSLGIFIDEGVIKYAKIQKDKEKIKLKSFKTIFYDNLENELIRILSETDSSNTFVSINSINESEFKSLEPIFSEYNLVSKEPITKSITNLIKKSEKENILVINLEKQTNFTTIINGNISIEQTLDYGMENIFSEIKLIEISEKKAYEICKNSTIPTNETDELYIDGNEYIDDIIPVIQNIIQNTQKVIDASSQPIEKIYITGLGSAINNIDLYFGQVFKNIKCEILKPFFVQSGEESIYIKDYIEVNSAIALAIDGINKTENGVNVKRNKEKNKMNKTKKKVSSTDKLLMRISVICILILVIYVGVTGLIMNRINSMKSEAESGIAEIEAEIEKVNSDAEIIKNQAEYYAEATKKLKSSENKTSIVEISKNSIPNLLKTISNVIPKEIKVNSIKNTTQKHIVIEIVSASYDQIEFFKSQLSNEEILQNVTTSDGEKVGEHNSTENLGVSSDWIYATIEGDLQ